MANDGAAGGGQGAAGAGNNGSGGAGAGAGSPPAGGAAGGDWTTSLSEGHRGFVQNKGWKSPGEVIDSYTSLEKLRGVPADRLIALPENFDIGTPEGRAVFERLGAPKDAKEYKFEISKEAGGEKLAEWLKDVGHKNGFTTKQMENFAKAFNETRANQIKSLTEQATVARQNQETKLRQDWGIAHDQNLQTAKSAAGRLGIQPAQLDALQSALGYDGVMKLMHQLGAATGEHNFVGGNPPNNGMLGPEAARAKIAELMKDRGFAEKIQKKDAEATRLWAEYHKMAYPGDARL